MASVTLSGTGELTPPDVAAGLGSATTVIIEGYTSIGNAAFIGNSQITSVTIGNSVTSIGEIAFWLCSNLTSVTIGNSVISIGPAAFKNCSNLTSVTFGNLVESIGATAFLSCTRLTSVTFGNSVTSIGSDAFQNCTSLTSITLGNSVESIGIIAFKNCTSLTSITIGNSVTNIGVDAFQNSGLTTVYIANGQIISEITFQSPASGVSFFGKIVTTIAPSVPPPPPPPAPAPPPPDHIFTTVNAGIMPPHLYPSSSDSMFSTGRNTFVRTSVPANATIITAAEATKRKQIYDPHNASSRMERLKMQAIGQGSMRVKPGEELRFKAPNVNDPRDALRRMRSGGYVVPAKVRARN